MTTYAKALYDFSGEANTSELSITVGEILTVTRTDVGEGWWEGKNSKGEEGLFPAAYVEYVSPTQVANGNIASPVLPVQQQQQQQQQQQPQQPPQPHQQQQKAPQPPRYDQTSEEWTENQEDWEDDWDDDNEYSEIGPGTINSTGHSNSSHQINNQNSYRTQAQANNYSNMNLPPTPSEDTVSLNSNTATIKKSGLFAKSGDSYILGLTTLPTVPEGLKTNIVQIDNYYYWKPIVSNYIVTVASPKKEKKFKGMKSFIAYQLTPSFSGISVPRRYKHFDWLHERLVDKFSLIPIPPLPDKQISGRYEEEFIEHRRAQLQEFVNWACRHPVLSNCEVWMHFLTCTDDKKWKLGKRQAEKDTLVGFNYCAAIFPPEKQLLQSYVDGQIDLCSNFTHCMDSAIKNLITISNEQIKRNQTQSVKDFKRIGDGIADLAKSLEIDERRLATQNSLALKIGHTSGAFTQISKLYSEQFNTDIWLPIADRLHIYRGILTSFPDILNGHKTAIQKRKDCERLASDQKMGNAQLGEVGRRADIISYSVMAEMNHFRTERDEHLKETMKNFIDAQIQFHLNIISKLQEAKQQFQ